MIASHFRLDELRGCYTRVESMAWEELETFEGQQELDRLAFCIRKLLRCIPSNYVKQQQLRSYLMQVLGAEPEEELVELVASRAHNQLSGRRSLVPQRWIIQIEQRQNYRCAVCGKQIAKKSNPHVDHVFPFMFGGETELGNLQILCQRCNLGKGSLLHWVMASPWFLSHRPNATARLAYCVLMKYRSRCSVLNCAHNARSSVLHLQKIVPLAQGGESTFDNLKVLCEKHHDAAQRAGQRRGRATFGFGHGFGIGR